VVQNVQNDTTESLAGLATPHRPQSAELPQHLLLASYCITASLESWPNYLQVQWKG